MVILKEFFEKVDFEKIQVTKKLCKILHYAKRNFACFNVVRIFFIFLKIKPFQKISVMNTIRVLNSLDPNYSGCTFCQGLTCLQRLSAEAKVDTSGEFNILIIHSREEWKVTPGVHNKC